MRRLSGPTLVIGLVLFSAAAIATLFWASHRALNQPIPAVAVLPFRSVTADSENGYFSDGLTMELIDSLTKVDQLRVTSWNSAVRFRGKVGNLGELRDQLQAGAVVDGTVSRQNDRLRLNARLIDTVSGQTIWSETYDRPSRDIFRIQEEIAKSIVYSLKVQLRVDPQRILVPPRTESMDAYDDYLRARTTADGLARSSSYARKAIGEDPRYAPAYALLAMNHTLGGFYKSETLDEAAAEAERLAGLAIAIDPSSGIAHAALGSALALHDWDWKAAEVELQRAIQWSPGSADTHAAYAMAYLVPVARFEQAEYEARRAIELDPLSFFANYSLGYVLLARAKYPQAVEQYRKALEICNQFSATHDDRGLALAEAGRKQEASTEFARACELRGPKDCNPGPSGYALLGQPDQSRKLLLESENQPPHLEVARAWAVIGDPDRAFDALDKALTERDPQLAFIQADPRFDNLRGDARYRQLLTKLNFRIQ